MRRWQYLLGLAGAVGLVTALVAGEAVVGEAVAALVALLGNDYVLMAAVAGLAVALAAPVLASGRTSNLNQTDMPEPERPVASPTPGDGFDRTANRWVFALPLVGRQTRAATRDRLRTAAVETVMRTDGCDRETATARIDDGTWTDDPRAAAFLAASGRRVPRVSGPVRALAAGETWFGYRAARTADAIASVHDRANERSGRESRTPVRGSVRETGTQTDEDGRAEGRL